MFSRFRFFVLALFLISLTPTSALAQNPPMDFSDALEPLLEWPFTTIEFFVEEDGLNVYQHTRVSESSTHIYDLMHQMKTDREYLGDFLVASATKQAQPGHYTISLAKNNTRYFVQVKPDGSGAVLIVKSTPNALVSGYFKRALYGYRLGEGLSVGTQRFDFMDE